MKYQWRDGSGLITLDLDEETVQTCAHQGQCDDDIEATRRNASEIEKQLQALDPVALKQCVAEYGSGDLNDIDAQRDLVLWIACGDCRDNPEEYRIAD